MTNQQLAYVAAPSIGPAFVTVFGIEFSPFALVLSLAMLVMTRRLAKPGVRKLTKGEEVILTTALCIILFLIVSGQLFTSGPLEAGSAVMWAVGLGMSGVLILELISDRVLDAVRVAFGRREGGVHHSDPPKVDPPEPPSTPAG